MPVHLENTSLAKAPGSVVWVASPGLIPTSLGLLLAQLAPLDLTLAPMLLIAWIAETATQWIRIC